MRLSNGTVLLYWPLHQHIITAGWLYSDGSTHHALDFRAAVGTPVYASESGTVDWVQKWDGKTKTGNQSYGNLVRITHKSYDGKRLQTYYAHLDSVAVVYGQAVTEGQIIGYSGNTGNSTGPHLHYEVRLNGNRVNPLNWLDDDFGKAYDYVILGDYTSVVRPESEKEEPAMDLKSDTFKIGPAGTNDKNAVAKVADNLGIKNYVEGDYLIVGPMSGEDRVEIYEKAQSLSLGCVDYIAPEDPEAQVDLAPVLERMDTQDKALAEISSGITMILDKLSAAGKALQ